jgi:DNA-binding HxlR family transcriptional regulator
LIVRELFCGSHRFNELESGLPRIPKSLLSERLRTLERVGIVDRRATRHGRGVEYYLTDAGHELGAVVGQLGEWGQRWVNTGVSLEDLDPTLLMWDVHRRIHLDRLPDRRVVCQFDFGGAQVMSIWLILERPEPSVCFKDPGFEIDLFVTTDTLALHQVWLGHLDLAKALRDGLIELDGPADLTRAFPSWLALSMFAGVAPATTSTAVT